MEFSKDRQLKWIAQYLRGLQRSKIGLHLLVSYLGSYFHLNSRSYVTPKERIGIHVSQCVDLQLNNQMIKARLRDLSYLPKVTNQYQELT